MLAVSADYFSLLRPARRVATAIVCSGLLLNAAPAQAQERVSLYGTVDTGIGWTRVSGGDHLIGTLSGGQTDSLWGLRGSEALANGFTASFTLESGFDPSTGSLEDEDRLFNYAAWIGIGHDELGEFRLGRQHPIGQRFGDELEIASWADFGLGALFKASDNYQLSNTISYLTPKLSGLQAGLSYSFNANEGEHFQTSHNARALSAGLRYEDGPLYATLTYDRMLPGRDGVRGSYSAQAWQLGASYDFEVIKLAAGWSRQSNGFVGLNGGDTTTGDFSEVGISGAGPMEFVQGGRVDAWFLGASLPLGPGRALAQWSIASPDWTWCSTGERAKKVQTYSLGYVYELSPRTSVYTFAAGGRNFSMGDTFAADNPTVNRIAAGLTHHF
ncbi:porin [Alcaligenaceae bacterium]|nr:porin [Alcaligenaceae bacterium]